MMKRYLVAIPVVLAALSSASPAEGFQGEYQLEFGFAKRAISHETAALCSSTEGCANWLVKPCQRRSWHRVDCVSRLYGENGVACVFVSVAVWPPSSEHLLLHHKRIFCGQLE
jgi:hypothetical protein